MIAQTTPFWHTFFEESVVALGAVRASAYHRYRQLVEGGVRVTFGSDFPATGDSPFDMAPLRNIEVGKQADLIILNNDIFAVPAHQFHQIRIATTMLAGEVIFGEIPSIREIKPCYKT